MRGSQRLPSPSPGQRAHRKLRFFSSVSMKSDVLSSQVRVCNGTFVTSVPGHDLWSLSLRSEHTLWAGPQAPMPLGGALTPAEAAPVQLCTPGTQHGAGMQQAHDTCCAGLSVSSQGPGRGHWQKHWPGHSLCTSRTFLCTSVSSSSQATTSPCPQQIGALISPPPSCGEGGCIGSLHRCKYQG